MNDHTDITGITGASDTTGTSALGTTGAAAGQRMGHGANRKVVVISQAIIDRALHLTRQHSHQAPPDALIELFHAL